ncbi:EpsG family protein [Pseudoalteromonas sp. SaAl2]
MLYFYVLSFLFLLGALLPVKRQTACLVVSFFVLFILSAFRETSVGTDTLNYLNLYHIIENHGWQRDYIEPAWILLNDIVAFIWGDYRYLMVLSSLIILVPLFVFAKKYSPNPMLTISLYYLLYFYFVAWNITRQSVSLVIVLFGVAFLLKNKKLLFISFVLFASLFHVSALIALILLAVNRVPTNKTILIAYVFMAMFIGIVGTDIVLKLIGYTSYAKYLARYEIGNVLGNFAFLLIFNCFFVFITLTTPKVTIEYKLYFLFLILLNVTMRMPFGDRAIMYFSIYQVFFYPYYLRSLTFMNEKLVASMLVVLFAYILFFREISTGSGGVFPYLNILF